MFSKEMYIVLIASPLKAEWVLPLAWRNTSHLFVKSSLQNYFWKVYSRNLRAK